MVTRRRRRSLARAASGWLFGLGSTVLLVGLWGRAVVVDTDQLAESLSPMAASDLVAGQLAGWLETEMVDAGVGADASSDLAGEALAHPSVGPLLEDVIAEGVEAAASEDPSGASVDVAAILAPNTAGIAAGLNDAGVPVSESEVGDALAALDPLVIRGPEQAPLVGPRSPLASTLGIGAALGILLMIVSGWAYVLSSRDRMLAVRGLLTRFALGALSFAVLLKIGSWIVDPEGGRAPVGESLSLLADSKSTLPMMMGLVALGAAALVWVRWRRLRPAAGSPSRSEPPIRQEA
jgi:hypothetical protein